MPDTTAPETPPPPSAPLPLDDADLDQVAGGQTDTRKPTSPFG